jgi:hypothetical protein
VGVEEGREIIGGAFDLPGEGFYAQGCLAEVVVDVLFTEGDFGMFAGLVRFCGFEGLEEGGKGQQCRSAEWQGGVGFRPGAAGGGFGEEPEQTMSIVEAIGDEMGGTETAVFIEDTLVPAHIVISNYTDKVMKRGFVMVKIFLVGGVRGNDTGLSGIEAETGPGQDEISEPPDLDEDFRTGVEMAGGGRGIFRDGGDDEGFSRIPGEFPDESPQFMANQRQGIGIDHIVDKS